MAGDRLPQLLGALALAANDRVRRETEAETGHGGGAAAALAHLHAHPGGSVNELARVLGISQPATVRALDRLAAAGLVARSAGPDRRTLAVSLTAAGAGAAERVLARRRAALTPLLGVLDATERNALEHLLERLVAGLADDRPTALTVCRLCDREACRTRAGCPLDHTAVDA
jgi:DNA-binding MarR family transcriptional regulator